MTNAETRNAKLKGQITPDPTPDPTPKPTPAAIKQAIADMAERRALIAAIGTRADSLGPNLRRELKNELIACGSDLEALRTLDAKSKASSKGKAKSTLTRSQIALNAAATRKANEALKDAANSSAIAIAAKQAADQEAALLAQLAALEASAA